ncbi:hypothetical protein AYO38_00585 [bacterium SCGC AG-212-C10]|nr:hypothetical protein AYO38_00585 [bacterium SCGC AG-212-C10]
MLVPGLRHKAELPAGLTPFLLGLLAIVGTVVAWAAFAARSTGSDFAALPFPLPDVTRIRSVAYFLPEDGGDTLYVRALDGGQTQSLATFPGTFTTHARGSASPAGSSIAVLAVRGPAAYARLTVFNLMTHTEREFTGSFDNLSPFAWSPDSERLAMTRSSSPPDAVGRVDTSIVETNVTTGTSVHVATFPGVLQAAPVGYSIDGERLFVVVVDQSGSWLWMEQSGQVKRLAMLSPGRTRDWRLSPDGARLAFIDITGGAELSFAGRTLVVATGVASPSTARQDQIGVAWPPRSDVPAFGGPGGSLRLTATQDPTAYVVPREWSPDGTTLAASVFSAAPGEASSPQESVELVTDTARERITERPGAQFIGWVLNGP